MHAGSARSKERLAQLSFDPIQELVVLYREVEALIQLEYKYRDREIIRFTTKGLEMAWYPDNLDKLLDKKMNISDKLLRYGYGRVPETTVVEDKRMPAFVVHTTKKGAVYHTGDREEDDQVVEG